jgi:[ribosomal protein S18]-alanine N-acetyltransferase
VTTDSLSVGPTVQPLHSNDIDAVMAIEQRAYAFPWSRGNFTDSLKAGHRAIGLWLPQREAADMQIAGYSVSMGGVEERHLLNLTIDPDFQGRGLAQLLLDDLLAHARSAGEARLWLEVRQSNQRAQALYQRRGFAAVGLRRGYYPNGHARREDAVVMALDVMALPGTTPHAGSTHRRWPAAEPGLPV